MTWSDVLRFLQLGISLSTFGILIKYTWTISKWVQAQENSISNLNIRVISLDTKCETINDRLDIVNEEIAEIKTEIAVLKASRHVNS